MLLILLNFVLLAQGGGAGTFGPGITVFTRFYKGFCNFGAPFGPLLDQGSMFLQCFIRDFAIPGIHLDPPRAPLGSGIAVFARFYKDFCKSGVPFGPPLDQKSLFLQCFIRCFAIPGLHFDPLRARCEHLWELSNEIFSTFA